MSTGPDRVRPGTPLRPWDRHPFRVGVIDDLPGVAGELSNDWVRAMQIAFDLALTSGVLDRPVEIVRRDVYGQPWQSAAPIIDAYRALALEDRVLAIIGPTSSDNVLALAAETERLEVPVLTMAGSVRAAGPHMFALGQGSIPDEPRVMVEWAVSAGYRSCAVFHEPTVVGREYHESFQRAAERAGLDVVATAVTRVLESPERLEAVFGRLAAANPDVLCYLGFGMINTRLNPALDLIGWHPPRVMTTAFVTASMGERWARALEGWHGVDDYDERNPVLERVVEEMEERFERRTYNASIPSGYDEANAIAHALGCMRVMTPQALSDALREVRGVPAAVGSPGSTNITFGPWDHQGYKGDYLVVRRATDGRSVLVRGSRGFEEAASIARKELSAQSERR